MRLSPSTVINKTPPTICPTTINGYDITEMDHNCMAAALYEKLASYNVISSEYLAVSNITAHYAAQHNGYQVLYELVEDVDPNLKHDTEMYPPNMSTCHDVHEYATRFK